MGSHGVGGKGCVVWLWVLAVVSQPALPVSVARRQTCSLNRAVDSGQVVIIKESLKALQSYAQTGKALARDVVLVRMYLLKQNVRYFVGNVPFIFKRQQGSSPH